MSGVGSASKFGSVVLLPMDKIDPSPFQVRVVYGDVNSGLRLQKGQAADAGGFYLTDRIFDVESTLKKMDFDTQYVVELAYWAGLFDGEGSIRINRYQNKDSHHKSPTYTVQLQLSLTDKQTVDDFEMLFKGTRTIRRDIRVNNSDQYCWAAKGDIAVATLKALRPFLRLKREKADLALEFHREKGPNPSRLLTSEELELREQYYQRMRRLNRRGRRTK